MEATEFLERIRLAARRDRGRISGEPRQPTPTEPGSSPRVDTREADRPEATRPDDTEASGAGAPAATNHRPFALAHQMVAAIAAERGEAMRIVELRMVPSEGTWGVVAVIEAEDAAEDATEDVPPAPIGPVPRSAPEPGAEPENAPGQPSDLSGLVAGLRDVAEPATSPPSPVVPLAEELLELVDDGVIACMVLAVDGREELVGHDGAMLEKLRALTTGVPVPGRLTVDTDQGSYRVLRQTGLDLAVALLSEDRGDIVGTWLDEVADGEPFADVDAGSRPSGEPSNNGWLTQ